MEKIMIPESFFDSKWGRIIYPWKYRKDKTFRSPFSNEDNIYEFVINKKLKTLSFGDDFFKCVGITTDLNLSAPHSNMINIDIRACTDHPFSFGGYDYPKIKNWVISCNQVIFKLVGHGDKTEKNITSTPLQNLTIDSTSTRILLSGQDNIEVLKITSPTQKMNVLNLTIRNCKKLKTVDLSEIKKIELRGMEDYYDIPEDVKFKFNPNLEIGLSTLHRWCGWDRYSPFKYNWDKLNEQYSSYDESGKMISIKEIFPNAGNEIEVSQKDLEKAINSFLLNKVYKTPEAFIVQQDYEKTEKYIPVFTKERQLEYEQWLKDEEVRKFKENEEHEKEIEKWRAEEKIRKEKEAAEQAEKDRLAKIAYEEKVEKFKKWASSLKPIQRAYLETIFEQDYWSFRHKMEHSSAFDYMKDPKLLSEIDSREKIVKILDDAIEKERISWCGPHDDGDSGCAEAMGKSYEAEMLEKMDKKVKEYSNKKTRG